MAGIPGFLKRHTLQIGFVAVLAPLVVLLCLQFVWLGRLERASAIAQKASLSNYLEAVGTEVQYFYRAAAERSLNLPAAFFTQGRLERAAAEWQKKPVEGARLLFIVDYTHDRFGNILIHDPQDGTLRTAPASDESLAIVVACTPWQMASLAGRRVAPPALAVDERSPEHRIVVNPITDEASHIVGVAGIILDEDYFRTRLLPSVIARALPRFFPDAARDELVVTVRDARGGVIMMTPPGAEEGAAAVTRRFPFVFEDWTVSLHSPRSTPERWARANFAFNMTLSGLLAIVLMGGILLSLRSASRAVKLSQMKSDFVSNVSHELRTPLASIRVFAELLRLGRVPSPEKVREYGEYIEAEGRRLTRLIDNILDFARIESGRKSYTFVHGDLQEVVAATLRTFEVHLRPSGFSVRFDLPADPLPSIVLDPDAIGQALHNLLDNAVKYSGPVKEIAVRLAREDGDLVLAVQDHGIGIPREEQGRIFERFHRVSTGLVHEVQGSGLGLSIVEHIVQVHGGRITVASEPGRGSTFVIRLPLPPRGGAAAPHGGR
ncbi:MAG: hypothetical protein DMF50_08005 [Acidobacteria bacterium]|nr:MAG: hypothetical protein DMF50_08005 [Acidobacteriota bacterium]